MKIWLEFESYNVNRPIKKLYSLKDLELFPYIFQEFDQNTECTGIGLTPVRIMIENKNIKIFSFIEYNLCSSRCD